LNGIFTQIITLFSANSNNAIITCELWEILKENIQIAKARNGYTNESPLLSLLTAQAASNTLSLEKWQKWFLNWIIQTTI
jgi:hypothetical protein